jgi:acyl carrier protein
MIRYIAHRGNTNGPNPELENRPDYIRRALDAGFDVEIDVWYILGEWWLGHDEPAYAVNETFLLDGRFWLHAKHAEALGKLLNLREAGHPQINVFYHENDAVTLTSRGYVWTYPAEKPEMTSRTIIVMPEKDLVDPHYLKQSAGICSDSIGNIHRYLPLVDDNNPIKPKPKCDGLMTDPPYQFNAAHHAAQAQIAAQTAEAAKPEKDVIARSIIQITAEQMGVNAQDISRDTNFFNDLNADSLNAIELLMEFEDKFEMSIPDEEAEKCVTVGQAIDYIKANLG